MKIIKFVSKLRMSLKHCTLALPVSAAVLLGAGPDATAQIPTDGMKVWLKADAVDTNDTNQVRVVGADTFIRQWSDSSGIGNNATQTVEADQPKYIAGALNDRPVLRFTTTSNTTGPELKLGDLSAQFPSAGSLFAVATPGSGTTTDGRYNLFDNVGIDSRWVANSWTETQPGTFRNNRTNFGTNPYSSWPQSGSHVYAMESSSSIYRFVIDGTQIGSTTGAYNSGSGQNWTIADRPSGGQQLNGDIAELILYDRVLTTAEANTVGAYLTAKYGVTTTYPPLDAAVPTDLTATPLRHGARLDWSASLGATGYKVKRATGSGGPYTEIATPSALTYDDLDVTLVDGTTYYYVVSATNSNGESDNSTEVSVAPSANPVNQTITFALGLAVSKDSLSLPFADVATASSRLPVSYSSDNTGVANVDSITGTVTIAGVGTAHILANQAGTDGFNPAPQVSQTLTVDKGTPVIAWANPAAISPGTPLSDTQLNATANVPGTMVYTPSAGTVLDVGSGQILHVDFLPDDPVTYNNAALDVTINVVPVITTTITALNVTAAATGAEILNDAVLVEANRFYGTASPVTLANGLTFGTDWSHTNPTGLSASHQRTDTDAHSHVPLLTSTTAFGKLMRSYSWSSYSAHELTIPDLTPGHTYRLQLISGHNTQAWVSVEGAANVTWSGGNTVLTASWLQSTGDTTANIILTRNGPELETTAYALHDLSALPEAPTGLTAIPLVGEIRLDWTASAGTASYKVKRALAPGGPYPPESVIGTPTGNLFIDTSVTNGVTYYYVVSAINVAGESVSNSEEVSASPTVTKADQTISFALGLEVSKTTIDYPFEDLATATSLLAVTYSVHPEDSAIVSVDADTGMVTILGVPGTARILANQAGNTAYNPAPEVTQVLTITQVMPVLTWSTPRAIAVGTPLSSTQLNATCTVLGTFEYTPPIDTVLEAGSQILSVHFTPDEPIPYATPEDKTVTLSVVSPDGPALINVNYGLAANAFMNGTYSLDPTASGSASQAAPAAYGGNVWNDFGGDTGAIDLLDSFGASTGVGMSWGPGAASSPYNDWNGLGTNRMLVSGRFLNSATYAAVFTLTGLNPGHKYDIYIASLHNTESNSIDFQVVGAGTAALHCQHVNATVWTDGQNYVRFADVVPAADGTLVVNAQRPGGGYLNGFQIQDMGATGATDYDTWASNYPGYDLTNPAADADGDGMSNQNEYAFGLNPTSGSSVNPITRQLDKTTGTFKYTRRATSNLAYTYEWSTTLVEPWGTFTPVVDPPVSDHSSPVEEITVQVPAAQLANPTLFLRVKAQ